MPPPLLIYQPLDKDDNAKIVFTEPMNYPAAITNFTSENQGKEYFEISLAISEATKAALYELDDYDAIDIQWKLFTPSNNTLYFEIKFFPPDLVSTDGLDPDRIRVNFLQLDQFLGQRSGLPASVFPDQDNYLERLGY